MTDNMTNNLNIKNNTATNAIRHARIAIGIIMILMLIMFTVTCYQTNLYEGMTASLVTSICIQVTFWLSLWISYRKPFIGLIIPTVLILVTSIIITNLTLEINARRAGEYTALILINLFTLRGTIQAYRQMKRNQ